MTRAYNFGAGPAGLPEEVLKQVQNELLDWHGHGMSVMEMSHRSEAFKDLMQESEQDFRELLQIPDNYKVLFLTGPAREQFAMIPMNLLNGQTSADYIDTGVWSQLAIAEAKKFCDVNVVTSAEVNQYKSIPDPATWQLDSNAAYVYYTANETVNGVEFADVPKVGDVPLVTDMTSNLLSRPLDTSQFALIFAGAQKNIGPAGLTIVIVREDCLGSAAESVPTVHNYTIQAENASLYYTPASFACYIAGLVFKWLKKQGGLVAMAENNRAKAKLLYDFIDNSDYYSNPIEKGSRSLLNIPFLLANTEHEKSFLAESAKAGLAALKGHRLVGGMRASIYNAMPLVGVEALVSFMQEFEKRNG